MEKTNNDNLKKIIINLPCSIIDILKKIDKNALGLVFVVDINLKLLEDITKYK